MAAFLKRYEAAVFVLLVLVSLGLHLYRLNVPAEPVFDEAYFTTYAADNVLRNVFFDVHPPLGKWIYALPLFFYPTADLSGADYVTFGHNPTTGTLQTNYNPAPFGNFPYVPLRLIGVLSGLLLLAGFYMLIRTLAGPIAAMAGTFLLVFENSLLLDTRLVLMDGLYISAALWALYFFFKERPRFLLAGALFGLALAVKLTAIVFIGPVLCALIIGERKRFWSFTIAAAVVLLVAEFGLSDVILRPQLSLAYDVKNFGWPILERIAGFASSSSSWIVTAAKSTLVNGLLMVTGYLGSTTGHPLMSPWYTWPFMWKPMAFNNRITLVGNPFVWLGSTAAFIGAFAFLVSEGIKRRFNERYKLLLFLVVGYISCLVPFFTLVHRATFLYHYFPALIFAIAIMGVLIGRLIEKNDLSARLALIAVAVLTITGFLVVAPHTYGL